ncbi:glycoside hydrolase family 97 protein [Hymenobacter sp. UV11]|uniref:glycoside hydrolase family 97 protein n=1 Tax=Hymenobacter sp. UV11 TaxID=1849735 RepID=UPI00105FC0CE|nr:glycoside hydrolase family 97 protein [Hymenobacter sp. UV11]TDN37889.1 Retaining alpha-galactosidase [Hymenobacter sp. UV11]TFZ65101.1 glycoside hydrolase family 97 protein [Hymenobacter sp. UV11]
MTTKLLFLNGLLLAGPAAYAQAGSVYHVKSPDGRLDLTVQAGPALSWSVRHEATVVLAPSPIALTLASGEVLGKNAMVQSAKTSSVNAVIEAPVYKKRQVIDSYNQLTLTIKGNYGLIARAYNDGVAYRFFTKRKGSLTIQSEQATFNFAQDYPALLPFVRDLRLPGDQYMSSFESLYTPINLAQLPAKKDTLAFLPSLVALSEGKKAVLVEADVEDYPGMLLQAGAAGGPSLQGDFARYPAEERAGGFHNMQLVVPRRESYIARTSGTRSFPWRAVVVSTADKELVNSDMVYKLAAPSRLKDTSWIRPGKVAWDWWNDWNLTHVDFEAGINTATYKYYIDFAAAHKLEYVILDEGWSDEQDILKISPTVDLAALLAYSQQRGVGIILWANWRAIAEKTDAAFAQYAGMGVKGFKIDFLDRDDQKMVVSSYTLARKAAEHHLLVDFHGMHKPDGLMRTYPNVLNYEGVKGLENSKWTPHDDVPRYDVTLPFIRMVAGPLDYTPGALRNATQAEFHPSHSLPMSQGTRCHQLAMYVVFEAPLQMLADSPSAYQKEPESTDFIAAVPTTFDQTVALDGRVGEYVALARQKAGTWYVGALTNWEARDLTLDMSFLEPGRYEAVIFRDGINADRDATDYTREVVSVSATDKLQLKLRQGGGWAARIYPKP